MAATLILRDAAAPTDPDSNLQYRYENTVNTPITTLTWLDDGRAIADSYELEGLSGSTCKVTGTANNPYTQASVAVTADGSTVNDGLIPGLGIVLNASFAVGWKAKVSIGNLMATDGSTTERFGFDVVEAGTTTTGFRVACVNTGSDLAQSCEVTALPGMHYTGTGATTYIENITNHSADARDKMATAGTYTITFANFADGTGDKAGYKVVDILVGGSTAVSEAVFDGATVYEYGVAEYDDTNDYLPGMSIMLANQTADPTSSTITLEVTDGYTWVELAADSSGSPGTYAVGDLTLTEPGENTGDITVSGTAYFWARMAMPSAATVGDIREINLRVRGLTT